MTPAQEVEFHRLWADQYEPTRRYAERMLGDAAAAEDICSRAFARLADVSDRRVPAEMGALLPLIVYGLVANERRDAGRRPVPGGLSPAKLGNVGPVRFLTQELAEFPETFNNAVRGLPEPERDAYILTELRGLTVREAAAVLDVPKSTVARRAETAADLIRKELA